MKKLYSVKKCPNLVNSKVIKVIVLEKYSHNDGLEVATKMEEKSEPLDVAIRRLAGALHVFMTLWHIWKYIFTARRSGTWVYFLDVLDALAFGLSAWRIAPSAYDVIAMVATYTWVLFCFRFHDARGKMSEIPNYSFSPDLVYRNID